MDFGSTVSAEAYDLAASTDYERYREERPSFELIEEKRLHIYHWLFCKIDAVINGEAAEEKSDEMKVNEIADIFERLMRRHFFHENPVFYFGP